MLRSLRRLAAPLSLALLLSLAACGSKPAATAPTSPPAPTEAPAPTRTPRPTREPTAAPEPTTARAPTAVVLSNDTPTSAPADGELQPVDIGPLETYAHDSGVFQIDIPNNWAIQDNSKPDELILVWTDPSRNGAVIVDIFEDSTTYTSDDLTTTLQKYLKTSFGKQPDFSMDDPTPQSDDSILIVWTYTATADNGVKADLLGNTFIEQRGNKISLLSTLVPSDQFDSLVDQTNEIINAYSIDTEASIQ
ncbi:hypothetical protein EKD04_008945 [Chloroflexales bacterium ZM16-3]|nr:hypothetical protein [Chloroflexales bacterium ZM16-3]